jgi:cell division septal protein FtsQ
MVLLLCVLGIGLYALFLRWPLFFIRDVSVSGNRIVPDSVLLEKVWPYVGTHIFKVNVPALEKHLRGFYQIESIKIKRRWPSHLHVTVTEAPVMVGVSLQGDMRLLDSRGRVLNTFGDVGHTDLSAVPIVRGVPGAAFLDQGLRLHPQWLTVIEHLVRDLPQRQMTLLFRTPQDVVLYYEDYLMVYLGMPARLPEKLTRLRWLLKYVDASMLEYVDIRFPENTVIKPKTLE